MPSEAADHDSRKEIERAHEQPVVNRPLPAAVKARLHRKPLRYDPNLAKWRQEPPELADAELQHDRRVLVFEAHFHQLRESIQPRPPVIDLEDRLARWFQDAV